MFQNAYQGHNNMINGTQNHQRFNNMQMHKQQQHHHYGPHGPMGHQQHHQVPMHQHNISGGFANAGHHALNFQDQMPNGSTDALGHDEQEDMDSEWWKEQHAACNECRDLSAPNQRAKNVAHSAKGISYIGADDQNTDRQKKAGASSSDRSDWEELDLGGQGLHALSPILFQAYHFIQRLDLGYNNLTVLPAAIGHLKNLVHLDLSFNQLSELPSEIGMLWRLKQLHLFHNRIQTLPYEIGFLYKLELLGVLGNPLEAGQKEKITEGGTKALVQYLKESMPGKLIPTFCRIAQANRRRSTTPSGARMASIGRFSRSCYRCCQSHLLQHPLRALCNSSDVWLCSRTRFELGVPKDNDSRRNSRTERRHHLSTRTRQALIR
jgi:CCR4-NOT transcription complex subunit 6